jgi:hypothetical protein
MYMTTTVGGLERMGGVHHAELKLVYICKGYPRVVHGLPTCMHLICNVHSCFVLVNSNHAMVIHTYKNGSLFC